VETPQSKIFQNEAFGYNKITVERPLRIKGIEPDIVYPPKEIKDLISKGLVDEDGVPVLKKIHKSGKADPMHGLYATTIKGKNCIVEYESNPNLRDSEQVPLLEDGGIEAFFKREVLPYVPDAWIDASKTQIGYEVSFTRYFYKPVQMRPLAEIVADIKSLENKTDGLLTEIVGKRD
jgi:type I restriction enzyme M protein